MDGIYVVRQKLQELYAEHSVIFEKGAQFFVALMVFYQINGNVGFVKAAASPVVTLALAIICTFFPVIVTVLVAAALMLVHMYGVSLGTFAVTAVIFLVMFIFYFRLTSKMAIVVLLMPVVFGFKIPLVVPMACALLSTPVSLIAIVCGTIVYYMMQYVKVSASALSGEGAAGLMTQVSTYIKQVFQNKEMWITLAAFMIAFLVIYTVKNLSVNHAWKVAIAAGAVINIIVNAVGDLAFGIHASYGTLIIGSLAAVIVGIVLEFLFFLVDYSRSENLQYEDDEYYYYVKAVPKVIVTQPEKTVKRINGHRETEIMEPEHVRQNHDRSERTNRTAPDNRTARKQKPKTHRENR